MFLLTKCMSKDIFFKAHGILKQKQSYIINSGLSHTIFQTKKSSKVRACGDLVFKNQVKYL